MKDFDFLSLDARALQVFIAVFETGSVTKASERIGITQSAASHTLEKLRRITDNPLFVRSAHGVTPTGEAERMIGTAREVFDGLQRLARPSTFQPEQYDGVFTIGITDYEQSAFFERVFQRLRREAPRARLALLEKPATIDAGHLLHQFDIAFSPYFYPQSGIYSAPLFDDVWLTYYDPDAGRAPTDVGAFSAAMHAVVMLGDHPRTPIDERLDALGLRRRVGLQVPSFAMLPGLLRGTDLIVTLLGQFSKTLMRGFAAVPCPLALDDLTLHMVWHARTHQDPAQRWLRRLIREEAKR